MTQDSGGYPAISYDRNVGTWEVGAEPIDQVRIGAELVSCLWVGLAVRGGSLRAQLSDGSSGREVGAVSIVWGATEYEDGSRTVLGWYELSRA